jgi:hypothetical protein
MLRNVISTGNGESEMQTASAPKDNEPGSGSLNWRQRKKANERRRQEIERRQSLVDGYVQALGGADRVSAIQMQDVERATDLVLLARDMRAAVRQGTAKISDLTRLEGAADRAVRRLNLPPPHAAAPVPTLAEYLAQRTTADEPEAGDT